jgi:single-strand DNA-binding protein
MSDTITIVGNIVTTPENKRTQSGLSITTFRVASSQRRFDRATAAWTETGTNWYSVSAFRGLADHAFQSLRRGERVVLTGRLRLRQWDNGTKQGTSADVEVDAIGHDLLWGTTVYTKDAEARPTDAWAVPGAPADESSAMTEADASVPDGPADWGIPAGAGGDAPRILADADTPF